MLPPSAFGSNRVAEPQAPQPARDKALSIKNDPRRGLRWGPSWLGTGVGGIGVPSFERQVRCVYRLSSDCLAPRANRSRKFEKLVSNAV
jgi:hypothetical protein